MAKTKTTPKAPNPMRLRAGVACYFEDDDGTVVEGIYRGGRKVEATTGFKQVEPAPPGTLRGFEMESTTYTVPPTITIHVGTAPEKEASNG